MITAIVIAFLHPMTGMVEDAAPRKGVVVTGVIVGREDGEDRAEKAMQPAAGAAVHVAELPEGWSPGPDAQSVTLKFEDKRLKPAFTCAQVGQKVVVDQPDGVVLAMSIVAPTVQPFGQLVPDPVPFTRTFSRPDDYVLFRSAIFPDVRARVQIVPTPGFTQADEAGKFTFPRRFPEGKHRIKAFLPGMGWAEQELILRGNEGEVQVKLQLAARKKK